MSSQEKSSLLFINLCNMVLLSGLPRNMISSLFACKMMARDSSFCSMGLPYIISDQRFRATYIKSCKATLINGRIVQMRLYPIPPRTALHSKRIISWCQ